MNIEYTFEEVFFLYVHSKLQNVFVLIRFLLLDFIFYGCKEESPPLENERRAISKWLILYK
jgi:hypothetical protein